MLNLAGHCDPSANTCTRFSSETKACRGQGIKVFLSLGGYDGSYTLSTANDAKCSILALIHHVGYASIDAEAKA